MPQPPEGMLTSRISIQACFDIVSSMKVTFFFTVPTFPQEKIKIWYGKSQLGGKVSYYSDKCKLCASTHTSHIPPTFRVKQCSWPSSSTEAMWVTTLRQEFYLLDSGAQQLLQATLVQDTGSELWGMIQTPLCTQGFLITALGSSHSPCGTLTFLI